MTAPTMTPTTDSPSAPKRSRQRRLPAPLDSAILGTYKRAPVEFVARRRRVSRSTPTGKRYLDFVSGIAVNALGYGDAGLEAAMHAAADGLDPHVEPVPHRAGRALAAALVEQSFADKVFFCNSGAEANEGAFKFARRWARTQRRREARDRRAARRVPRPAVRHARRDRSSGVSRAVPSARRRASRSSSATSRISTSRSSADTVGGADRRAGAGRGRRARARPGFLRELRALTQGARRRAHLRRDPVRPRPHRDAVRLRAVRRRAGHADAGEAARRRTADGRRSS